MTKYAKSSKGFTLIELAVVLVIIGILAGIVLINIGAQAPRARDTKRVADLRNVQALLNEFNLRKGNFPPEAGWGPPGGVALGLQSAGVIASLDQMPLDPIAGSDGADGNGAVAGAANADYSYFPCQCVGGACTGAAGDKPQRYILRSQLEAATTTLLSAGQGDIDGDGAALRGQFGDCIADGGGLTGRTLDCRDTPNRYYCIGF